MLIRGHKLWVVTTSIDWETVQQVHGVYSSLELAASAAEACSDMGDTVEVVVIELDAPPNRDGFPAVWRKRRKED